ncbi:multidrug ABC transporter ATP-binding protein [bacterium (Candidatus Blackallbacteria) CG17_big_fil_post_rev_8_21_14_2_50_48_46]|uniref:Multidrug ABC transporter ATP-binding protein n=1 Tax=bacterium (Candidatus Blackallbacteria) CG17_big_fil_post_rev_8_21_14_2_50_48_46 TaxID=2014261 RepID=A0A2M7G964_9BACT|nr:MAG: multidrug ABC transporter ATP-binding protein [bacterium (Candidatus Blackallbacteria) CG18_big_fil_WC_8_21_14_2_50_49_26]PIW18648.1 MAG: multidrug ABC transporter ATP-binding protein [bacterium (Candidatus Blackallbacteria) CG17_big_fil_post_rev_8_21_14_2_50_48_46]PIW46366.1 MAG: multidrug ABC transporter ATP-binding protein [bacterium (Candidatus Blackallbacteria) CG13_big_fil_rev_8_21_14_2_50_49_14]
MLSLPPSELPAIEIRNLGRHFGDFQAVKDLNLTVPQGAFFGFLGPNGAGKSTTLKMLTGLLQPHQGQIKLLGEDIWAKPGRVKQWIGVVPEKLSLFERLTASEYLEFVGGMYGLDQKTAQARSQELLELMQLEQKQETLLADFSHGMKKKTALAAALIHSPRILFLDEPFEGVDPVSAKILRDLLLSLTSRQVTVFLTSHILEIVEKLCNFLGIIHQGELLTSGPLQEVLDRMNQDKPLGTASLEETFIQLVGQKTEATSLSWMQ